MLAFFLIFIRALVPFLASYVRLLVPSLPRALSPLA